MGIVVIFSINYSCAALLVLRPIRNDSIELSRVELYNL
jgi:hypothetical protein